MSLNNHTKNIPLTIIPSNIKIQQIPQSKHKSIKSCQPNYHSNNKTNQQKFSIWSSNQFK